MKTDKKKKAFAICLIFTLAFFHNYGITHPKLVTEFAKNGYYEAGKNVLNNFSAKTANILLFILKI